MRSRALRNITNTVKYFCFNKHLGANIKQQLEIVKVLKPLKKKRLISYRSYFIYLYSYISRSFGIPDKASILINHYNYLQKKFSGANLEKLFAEGIECLHERAGDDVYTITFSSSSLLEFEGSMLLNFKLNGISLSTLSFTFVPGKLFNIDEEDIIYISGLQRDGNQLDNCYRAKKYFKNTSLSVMLMTALEGIAISLNIKTCIGISSRNQLSLNNEQEYTKFYSVYDQFWLNNDGVLVGEDYVFKIPIPQKDVQPIPKNQKEIVLKKRLKLEEIYKTSRTGTLSLLS